MQCLKGYCRSPVACGSFGYCREKNFTMTPQEIEAYGAKVRRENACNHDWQASDNSLIDRCVKCGAERA